MPILKGVKVDEFENVTVLVVKEISFRHKRVEEGCQIVIAEASKTESEVMFQNTETESICWSDQCHAVDMIIDFPNEKAMQAMIDQLMKVKNEMYPPVIEPLDPNGEMIVNPICIHCGNRLEKAAELWEHECPEMVEVIGGLITEANYEEAKKLVIEAQQCSTSFLQRKLKIGYNRASRMIQILQDGGVVGPADSSTTHREVLIKQ